MTVCLKQLGTTVIFVLSTNSANCSECSELFSASCPTCRCQNLLLMPSTALHFSIKWKIFLYRHSCFRSQIAFVVTAQWCNSENVRPCRVGSHQLLYASAAWWSNNELRRRRLLVAINCTFVFPEWWRQYF